jgi:hypothetical protein
MARMGHDGERAALICQYQARGADKAITNAVDAHVDAERTTHRPDASQSQTTALEPAGQSHVNLGLVARTPTVTSAEEGPASLVIAWSCALSRSG